MAEPRKAQTLQERFGFMDHDLKTPGHDAIMLWLDANVIDICIDLLDLRNKMWTPAHIQNLKKDAGVSGMEMEDPEPPSASEGIKKWEYPIVNGNYTIGFVDMFVQMDVIHNIKILREDHRLRWSYIYREPCFAFEVKTTIPSLGEVIRQIRLYQQYLHAAYVIVSPDTRWVSALKSQGIGFIECPKG